MFGFHKRGRSLISVKDLEKMEGLQTQARIEEEHLAEEEAEPRTPAQMRNLIMICLLFLAEAIMASSLSAQVEVLLPSAAGCMGMDASFLRSIFECAYFLGSTSGLLWGRTVDWLGRRKVALTGLAGMGLCCVSMGFATTFVVLAVLRFIAGTISSAVSVAGLAMLADVTHGSSGRALAVARLPLIAVCGNIGPLAAIGVRWIAENSPSGAFTRFPALSGQLACSSLVLAIALAEGMLLKETLPQCKPKQIEQEEYQDCEKAAFLGQSLPNDSEESLNVSIIEAQVDDASTPLPSRITINQMLVAPSVLLILTSFSILSLHSATFDALLPHLGHTASHEGGMGIPCSWLGALLVVVKALAAFHIVRFVPSAITKLGLLPMYRRISLSFPVLYAVIPILGFAISATGAAPLVSTFASTIAMILKTTLAGATEVLLLLLVLSAAPDASSTGTVIGVVSIAQLFKALAVSISGISYYLSDDYSVATINCSLWSALAAIAVVGAAITWKLRETPRVGADIPETCLTWQGMFDAESDEEAGF